ILDIPFGDFQYKDPDFVAYFNDLRSSHPLLKERIKWVGSFHKEILPFFYNLSDIYINLTLHHDEQFGYTQVEAMSCGTPVIGT
ncbi:MAG: glycosyltransferase, partial [Candidatus Poribacteria bacterium]|nr:glycosyltransferase [Candidatus Poribacteria bacterium]